MKPIYPISTHPSGVPVLKKSSRQGFALAIAIMMMALLLLLLVAFSTFSMVELQVAEAHKETEKARNNAIYGLQMALGQLQKHTGPDQRVSARADIFEDETEVRHPLWTGVWDSRQRVVGGESASDRYDRTLVWLVSGNDLPDGQYQPVDTEGDTLSWPILMSYRGAGEEESTEQVRAPRSSIDDNGHYAFWVGDEGVKARLNYLEPEVAQGNAVHLERNRLVSVPKVGAGHLFGADYAIQDTLFRNRLANVTQWEAFGLLGGDWPLWQEMYQNDFTAYSRGLAVNVKDGGLKEDLTALLGNDSHFNNRLAGQVVYRFPQDFQRAGYYPPVASGLSVVGPRWELAREHYRAFEYAGMQSVNPSARVQGALRQDHGGNLQSINYNDLAKNVEWDLYSAPRVDNLLFEAEEFNNSVTEGQRVLAGRSPVLVQSEIRYYLESEFVNSGPDGIQGTEDDVYYIRLHMQPVFTLMNPYNVELEASVYHMEISKPGLRLRARLNNPDNPLNSHAFTFTGRDDILNMNLNAQRNNQIIQLRTGNVAFQPGERKTFSISGNQEWDIDGNNNKSFLTVEENINSGNLGSRFIYLAVNPVINGTGVQPADNLLDVAHRWPGTNFKPDFNVGEAELEIRFSGIPPNGQMFFELFKARDAYDASVLGVPGNQRVFRVVINPRLVQNSSTYVSIGRLNGPELNPGAAGPLAAAFAYELYLKTPEDDPAVRTMANFNPRAYVFNADHGNYFYNEAPNLYLETAEPLYAYRWRVPSEFNGQAPVTGWGNSRMDIDPVVLFEVPRDPLLSVGQLQHVNFSAFSQQPAYALGNSVAAHTVSANAMIEPANALETAPAGGIRLRNDDPSSKKTTVDLSYMLNEMFWDRYFFSSVPTTTLPANKFYPGETFNEAYVGNRQPLPNPRNEIHTREDGATDDSDLLNRLRDPDSAAAHLLVNGAFNVNSTSVAAWSSMLGALRGQEVEGAGSSSDSPLPRMLSPHGQTTATWSGYATLGDDDLTDLAVAIVEEVKTRGPFMSMADFVNRRLEASPLGTKGALQAAIDNSGINPQPGGEAIQPFNDMIHPLAASGFERDHTPASLTQGDILQAIGSVLAARSETFVIRAYGDVVNPVTGDVTSKVWCEAVVQRFPDYVDATDIPETRYDSFFTGGGGSNLTNEDFGRQYRILSFRWLGEDEV